MLHTRYEDSKYICFPLKSWTNDLLEKAIEDVTGVVLGCRRKDGLQLPVFVRLGNRLARGQKMGPGQRENGQIVQPWKGHCQVSEMLIGE